jgi:hypothetical protein
MLQYIFVIMATLGRGFFASFLIGCYIKKIIKILMLRLEEKNVLTVNIITIRGSSNLRMMSKRC